MPKIKTHRGAAKRFSLTKSGKIRAWKGFQKPHPDQENDQEAARTSQGRLYCRL